MHEVPDMVEVLQVQLEKSSTQRVEALKKAEMMEAACERAEAARADVGREALRVQTDADTHRVELEVRLKPFDPLYFGNCLLVLFSKIIPRPGVSHPQRLAQPSSSLGASARAEPLVQYHPDAHHTGIEVQ
jgi:hypothetical protein